MGPERVFAAVCIFSSWTLVILAKVDHSGEAQKYVPLRFNKGTLLCVLP